MTADDYGLEEDGASNLLSSTNAKRPKNTMSARRKMWGEDGNGARRIKLNRY